MLKSTDIMNGELGIVEQKTGIQIQIRSLQMRPMY
jgi:hypothetical protein